MQDAHVQALLLVAVIQFGQGSLMLDATVCRPSGPRALQRGCWCTGLTGLGYVLNATTFAPTQAFVAAHMQRLWGGACLVTSASAALLIGSCGRRP
jgi:hypothetical protein